MEDLERFLDLVRRELRCVDARFEFGGHSPDDAVWAALPGGWRVVASGPGSGADADARRSKLELLVASFSTVGSRLAAERPRPVCESHEREVDETLRRIVEQTRADRAIVIDRDSPVLWGSSESPRTSACVEAATRRGELARAADALGYDLPELVCLTPGTLGEHLAPIDGTRLHEQLSAEVPVIGELWPQRTLAQWRTRVATWRAIAGVRGTPETASSTTPALSWFAREFAGIYRLIVVYAGPCSELLARDVTRRALPVVQRQVLALPPIDPTPRGATVLSFTPP